MTLKEELEVLRGEPIAVYCGDPIDIPCIETSDSEKLCKNPVVSVNMITYNHEPYIRQAIEGVMMQKTDFEFELVIGEDCSTDKTREICFEYQKRYPDKIRVLWWHENLRKVRHPAGGNLRRNNVHCRGEFIALCEGDDYWIDPLKLQKQVDVVRKYPNVGLCFCGAFDYREGEGVFRDYYMNSTFPVGLICGFEYVKWNLFGSNCLGNLGRESFVRTATTMFRVDVYKEALEKFDVLMWKLRLGDVPIWLSLSALSDVYYLQDRVAVYRRVSTGACATLGAALLKDNFLVRIYFQGKLGILCDNKIPRCLQDLFIPQFALSLIQANETQKAHKFLVECSNLKQVGWVVKGTRNLLLRSVMWCNLLSSKSYEFFVLLSMSLNRMCKGVLLLLKMAKTFFHLISSRSAT